MQTRRKSLQETNVVSYNRNKPVTARRANSAENDCSCRPPVAIHHGVPECATHLLRDVRLVVPFQGLQFEMSGLQLGHVQQSPAPEAPQVHCPHVPLRGAGWLGASGAAARPGASLGPVDRSRASVASVGPHPALFAGMGPPPGLLAPSASQRSVGGARRVGAAGRHRCAGASFRRGASRRGAASPVAQTARLARRRRTLRPSRSGYPRGAGASWPSTVATSAGSSPHHRDTSLRARPASAPCRSMQAARSASPRCPGVTSRSSCQSIRSSSLRSTLGAPPAPRAESSVRAALLCPTPDHSLAASFPASLSGAGLGFPPAGSLPDTSALLRAGLASVRAAEGISRAPPGLPSSDACRAAGFPAAAPVASTAPSSRAAPGVTNLPRPAFAVCGFPDCVLPGLRSSGPAFSRAFAVSAHRCAAGIVLGCSLPPRCLLPISVFCVSFSGHPQHE